MRDSIIIIQARMGSTRLPGKTMEDLHGIPLLAHVYNRCKRSRLATNQIYLAIPTGKEEKAISQWAQVKGVPVFAGPEKDVLKRYSEALQYISSPCEQVAVVRITADCPVIDPNMIDLTIAAFWESYTGTPLYVSNTLTRTFPDGQDVEVMSQDVIFRMNYEITDEAEREHVTLGVRHMDSVRRMNIANSKDLGDVRMTVDTQEDLENLRCLAPNMVKYAGWRVLYAHMLKEGRILRNPKEEQNG